MGADELFAKRDAREPKRVEADGWAEVDVPDDSDDNPPTMF